MIDEVSPWIIILLIAAGYAFVKLNARAYRNILKTRSAVVCSLGDSHLLLEQAEADADIYRRHFPNVSLLRAATLDQLLAKLRSTSVFAVHLLCKYTDGGRVVAGDEEAADIAQLFEVCKAQKILFVYLAADMNADSTTAMPVLIKTSKRFKRLQIAITSERGEEFTPFLFRLLQWIAGGKLLFNAWLAARPQDAAPAASRPAYDPGPKALILRN